jgi:hypothetical protein
MLFGFAVQYSSGNNFDLFYILLYDKIKYVTIYVAKAQKYAKIMENKA